MSDTKRQHDRVKIRALVDYENTDAYFYDYADNLSEGGIYLETMSPLPQGTDIKLRFTLPGIDRVFVVDGTVRWVKPSDQTPDGVEILGGMGVVFTRVDDADVGIIMEYIKEHVDEAPEDES